MLNFHLTSEQLSLQKKAQEFALKEVLPVAWYYDKKDETPLPLIRKAFEEGFAGADIPKEYGGKGLSLIDSAIITEEIAAACPGLATSIFDSSLGMEPLLLSNNEKAKRKYLPKIACDFKLAAFATSEPTMGSDVAGISCQARQDGNDFILNGTKYWITNGGIADYISVFATVDSKTRHKGICAFFVETSWEGVTRGRPIPKMGQRCSNTVGVHFENVRVPAENVIALPGEGFVLAMKTFARTRPIIGSFGVGAARAALEYSLDYVKKRHAFGMPIANFQAIQFKLSEMFQKVETSRLLTWKAAWESDQGLDGTVSASTSKLYASETALEVVNEALQIFAGYGYTEMFPIEKLLRDVRLLRIYEGTSEIQRMILADYLMKKYESRQPRLEDLALHRDHDPLDPDSAVHSKRVWRCRICGYVHYNDSAPEKCPYCFFPEKAFKEITT
ncbi:acyl-CoA dehydrogenase family protein [Desulfosediminicola sp.]|uniref:acyl-CoA dehydrogenase family protein n=1 Tax=Desulfosediminicola sp. TaxID=2886825 RepID=UPI003AF26CCC